MTDLLTRLESAETGSRELDALIANHISEWINLGGGWRRHKITGASERYDYSTAPSYTTSVDAALSLIPEGWEWEMRDNSYEKTMLLGDPLLFMTGTAATIPLAIVIAALRARDKGEG